MEIENVLDKISMRTKKRKSDLKRSFNAILKKKKEELEGIGIDEEEIEKIAAFELCKKVGIEDPNELLFEELDDDDAEEDDEVEFVKPESPKSKGIFSSLREKIPKKLFESRPSLIIQYGARYTISLDNPEKPPREWVDNKRGLVYYIFDVTLHKVTPKEMYEDIFDVGDHKGEPMYVDGEKYSLWLYLNEERGSGPMPNFLDFWERVTDDGEADNRKFIYYKKQKKSEKGTKYTDHIFKEA